MSSRTEFLKRYRVIRAATPGHFRVEVKDDYGVWHTIGGIYASIELAERAAGEGAALDAERASWTVGEVVKSWE